MRVLNTQQMREADRQTIDEVGLPSIVLMENAGRQAVAAMEASFEELASSHVGVLCGRGNNGGDGFVVARTLAQRGIEATVFLLGSVSDVRGDARTNLEILGRVGVTVVEITDAQEWELHFSEISECDLIVDAIVGTGFHGPLTGLLETVVADVNGLGVPVVAIDLPTGVSADSHELTGEAIEASMTVTLAAPKVPLILPPADAYGGDLVIADIGIPASVIDELEGPWLELLTREPQRRVEVHAKAALLRKALAEAGVAAGGASAIVPLVVGDNEAALALQEGLARAGFDARAVRPPTVPEGQARLRVTVRYPVANADLLRFAAEVGRLLRMRAA